MNTTFTTEVYGNEVTVDSRLKDFKLLKMPSSNVDYYGINIGTQQLFIQFLNGNCYVYSGVPKETLEVVESAESIGKAYYQFIKGKFDEEKVGILCVKLTEDEEEDGNGDDEWEFGDRIYTED